MILMRKTKQLYSASLTGDCSLRQTNYMLDAQLFHLV